jgi:hypothetical protein
VRAAFANMDTSMMVSAGDEQRFSVSLVASSNGFGRNAVFHEDPTDGGKSAPLALGLIVKTGAGLGTFVVVFGP